MGAITTELDHLLQAILDIVMIKTGLVISEEYLCEILNEEYGEDNIFKNVEEDRKKHIRIRSEKFDEYCSIVRKRLGETDRTFPNFREHVDKMMAFNSDGYDIIKAEEYVMGLMAKLYVEGEMIKPHELLILARIERKYPIEMISEILNFTVEQRELTNHIFPIERELWDGGDKLEDLFEKELVPKFKNEYFDQKFINYLEANPDKLEFMNWRNFERLTAEFFNRFDFDVELGPGTNDGGVDVRVYNKKDKTAPLIIIQCKRHKGTNDVKINTVKALYSDLEFENAKYGLIATTSRVAPGGKEVCSIRKYPIGFAENSLIKKWVEKMAKK